MQDNHTLEHGHISLIISIITGVFAWISSHNISETIKILSMILSGCAAIMAMRYYYFATKKIKRKR